jgi:hypothetical protein
MLRRVGSRSEFPVRRKQRTIGRLYSWTKFNPRQHNRPGKHGHPAGRHNPDNSRLDVAEWDFSEYNDTWVYFPERDAWLRNPGIHRPRLDVARCDYSGIDIAEWRAKYNYSGLDIAERHAEYNYTRINFAERDPEYDNAGINFAKWDAQYHDPGINVATNHASG